jgi:multiple sugar transport system substrate-binding protein
MTARLTRRSLLGGASGLLAAGAVSRPYLANAQAKTAEVWWTQGFVPDEDVAFRKLVADYEKQSGNKIEYSIVPFAPLREKEVSAITSGIVPDIMEFADFWFCSLQSWQNNLLDVSDIVESQKAHYSDISLISLHCYNSETKRRAYYGVPMKTAATPFHIWRSLVEKAGHKESEFPKTWDAFIDFFQPIQHKLQELGMRHTYASGFVVSTIGLDPINTFNSFVTAYGGKNIVTPDGRYHGSDPEIRQALVTALTKLTTMFKGHYIPPSSLNWNDADDNNAFHSKLCVMDYDGSLSTELALIKDQAAYDDMITQPLPLSNDGKKLPSQIGVFGAVVPKGAKNPAVAKDFLKYSIQPEILNSYLKGGLGRWAPPMPELVKSDPWWLDEKDPHRATHTQMAVLGPSFPWYEAYNPAIAQVEAEHLYQIAFNEVVSKDISPAEAMDKAIKRAEEIFAKYPIAAS